ncbi:MAG: response regulator [Planctomycetes bacterium]|nr:response regulator [Planctomycetota bacterium]
MPRLRMAVLALIAVGVLLYFFLASRGMEREEHSTGLVSLIALRNSYEELDRQVLSARSDPARAGERLSEALQNARDAELQASASTRNAGSAGFATKLSDYRSANAVLSERIASLGQACAHWGRALRELPDRVDALEKSGKLDPDTQSALHVGLTQLAMLQLNSTTEPTTEMAAALGKLRLKAKLNPAFSKSLGDLVQNFDTLLARKKEIETEIEFVQGFALAHQAATLVEMYEAAFDERLENAEHFRLGLYVFSVALLGRLLQIMLELKKRTREIHEVNRTLEERVDERTLKLSAANLALKVEIVERERAEIESQKALAQAEAASRTKSEFLANTSHEIRTPMTSILGFSERLLDPGLSDADKVEALSRIRRNGEHLLQVINDILDISKIEAGMLAVEAIPCSPHAILAEVHGAMDVRAAIAGIELKVESIGGIPETILTDPVRLKQVLINLVGNAIKFTQRGWVRLLVTLESGDSPRLRFAIMDTGIGMDAETCSRLFKPFMQADSSTTRRFGGTGLGLSICKHLVERLGGAIEVTSDVGKGSVFTFSVDIGPIEGVKMLRGQNLSFLAELSDIDPQFRTPRLVGTRILLVEDGEDNRRLIGFILSAAEAQVEIAIDGQEALNKIEAAEAAGKPFNVILMDMQMPVLDGYEAARRLRARGCQSTVIALTAHAMSTDREKCLEAGCDDFCTKPIVRHLFLTTIAKWVEKTTGRVLPTVDTTIQSEVRQQQDDELLELVRMFVADLDTDVQEMRTALAAGNMDELAVVAHRLKGAAGSYGFPSLTTHASILEKNAKSGASREELERDLAAVEKLCAAAAAEKSA